ncbi:MAG TPA: HEAT repeat domain-containing protein, partial [Polyangiaceae bacterium]
MLERVQPSEDAQATYAITAVLEQAQFASVRTCAAQALGRQPTTEAQSFLLDLAEDPEPEVHRSALEALANRDAVARAAVVEATHNEDLELRVSAALALLKAKRAEAYSAAALVLPLVEDAETLSSVIDALGQAGDPQALPVLEALLDNAERDSHLRAISALGELGVPSAAVRLAGLLEVGSSEEFSTAAAALHQLSPETASSKLRALLASGNSERRELALSALLSLALPELTSIMRQQLESGDVARVSLVLHHLIRSPDPSLEAELIALADHPDRRLQLTARRALSKLATPAAQAALQRLTSSAPEPDEVPANRLLELARDPSESAQNALIRQLEGQELEAGVWAAVVEVAPTRTVQHIAARSARVAGSAQEGLINGLGRRGDPAFTETLRAHLGDDPAIRNDALAALVALGDESVLPDLKRLAEDGGTADRTLAAELLSTRPDADAARELERLGEDPDPQVMSRALHALQARSPELVGKLA